MRCGHALEGTGRNRLASHIDEGLDPRVAGRSGADGGL